MRNKHAILWIWMCLLPLALDYKAPDAQSGLAAQWLVVIPALGSTLILVMIAPRFTHPAPLRTFVATAVALSIGGSVVTQLAQGNDVGNYLRVLLPFMLLLLRMRLLPLLLFMLLLLWLRGMWLLWLL